MISRDEYLNGIRPMIKGIKRSARLYYQITKRPLGVTGEIAEFEAIDKLKLHPVPPRQSGHDALELKTERSF